MTLSDKALITSEFATPKDVAKRLRIPAGRVSELERLMRELRITQPDRGAKATKPRGSRTSNYRAAAPSKKP
jgi:hypothetical protein